MSISEKKFNKVLTGILVVVVVGIVLVGAVFGRSIVEKIIQNKEAENAVNEFDQRVTARRASSTGQQTNTTNETENLTFDPSLFANSATTENVSDDGVADKQTYKGYAVAGKIEIPKTKLNIVVLDRSTKESMEVAVGIAYGPGLNKVGNTVILGHNYRNNSFFSNNDKIEEGDPIYVTDSETGTRIKYVVYNKYVAGSDEFDYATRDTAGKREISLSTCTDDVKSRLIIWAKEE
jgi:LPXTG-site transpeptidase (sortase) family protein